MIRVFVHENGVTRREARIDPAWLAPDSGRTVWVDLAEPTEEEGRILTDVFHFHELAVESALRAKRTRRSSRTAITCTWCSTASISKATSTPSRRTKPTSSSARTIWSPSTTVNGGASRT